MGVLLTLCLCLPGLLEAVEVSAILEPNPVPLGENARYIITVEGGSPAQAPQIAGNADVEVAFIGSGNNTSIINGDISVTRSYTYIVQAKKLGKYRLPPVTIEVDGEEYQTDELILEVVKNTEAESLQTDSIAAVEIGLPERPLYVGESYATQLTLKLNTNLQFSNLSFPKILGESFILSEIPQEQPPRQSRTVVNGKYFNTFTWDVAVTPVKAGTTPLQVSQETVVAIPEKRSSSRRDPFDIFNDDFFPPRYTKRQLNLISDNRNVEVLPLPEHQKPESFSGAIGDFSVSCSIANNQLKAGDPITLSLTVSGTGNFARLTAPAFTDEDNFKTYPPRVSDESLDQTQIEGSKTFEYILIPRSADIVEVPPIAFSWFNPQAGEYSELNTEAIPVFIESPERVQTSATPQLPKLNLQNQANDTTLLPLKLTLGDTVSWIQGGSTQRLITASLVTPIAILGLIYFLLRNRRQAHNNLERQRRRELDEALARRRKDFQQAQREGNTQAFYEAGSRMLQITLARPLGCKPDAITRTDIEALWTPSLGSSELLAQACAFLDKTDALRYSGGAAANIDFNREQNELETLLRNISSK